MLPPTEVSLQTGASLGVTLMYIVLVVAPAKESVAVTATGCANVPSPLSAVFIEAVAKAFHFNTPAVDVLTKSSV